MATHINSLLLSDLASDEGVAVDVDQWDDGVDAVGQTGLSCSLCILTGRVAWDKVCYHTWGRGRQGYQLAGPRPLCKHPCINTVRSQ